MTVILTCRDEVSSPMQPLFRHSMLIYEKKAEKGGGMPLKWAFAGGLDPL